MDAMIQNKKKLIIRKTPIEGLLVIDRRAILDDRGAFTRIYCEDELSNFGFRSNINQINISTSYTKHTVRGFHFQYPPFSESKIITCIRGEVLDIAIDIRKGSPTFLQSYGVILSEDNRSSHCLPEGFAHGFQCITDDAHLLYLHSKPYNAESEGGVNIFDPLIGIDWPYPPKNVSDKDLKLPLLTTEFKGI